MTRAGEGPIIRPLSGAPLDLGPAAPPAPGGAPTFDLPEGLRYHQGGTLGRGGMGEIRVARDLRLDRELALKCSRRSDPIAEARLAREARLTAGLIHPNIVPIYDATRLPDGRPGYTMPVVTGQTLGEALGRARDLADRLRLMRHFIDACGAVAFAHSKGVLHRDLKPDNILIGSFGETLVVDWGLACNLDEGAQGGARLGTPGYSSPEQQAGGPVDPRSDVWSLGAILMELLCPGDAPPDDAPPPELVAVGRKARADRPSDRYPDAHSLGTEVEAWFEGRRVAAYHYTSRDLLRRLWQSWRSPLLVGMAGALALLLTVAVGVLRISEERYVALEAQDRAIEAQKLAESSLATALVAQALQAANSNDRAEAEVLASHALGLRENPLARGVLARFAGRPRPQLLSRRPLPAGCQRVSLSAQGGHLLCDRDDRSVLLDAGDPRVVLGSVTLAHQWAQLQGEGVGLVLHLSAGGAAAWTPGGEVRALDLQDPTKALSASADPLRVSVQSAGARAALYDAVGGRQGLWPACAGALAAAVAADGQGRLVAACTDGRIEVGDVRDPSGLKVVARLDPTDHTPMHIAFVQPESRSVVVGSAAGRVSLVALDGSGLQSQLQLSSEGIERLSAWGDRLAVATHGGEVIAAEWSTGQHSLYLRDLRAAVSWLDQGRRLRVASLDRVDDWALPPAERPHRLPGESGIASVAVSPDGGRVASGHGSGAVLIWDLRSGKLLQELAWQEQVTKDLAWTPDGALLAAATAGKTGLARFDTRTWQALPSWTPDGFRRVVAVASGELWAIPYGDGLWRMDPSAEGGRESFLNEGVMLDLEVNGDGSAMAVRATDGGVYRVQPGRPPRITRVHSDLSTQAVAPIGRDTLVADGSGLHRFDPTGGKRSVSLAGAVVTDLTASPDGRWVAAGFLDGRTAVYRGDLSGPVAILDGHAARVAAVAFDATSDWLYTGSWDGAVRSWSMEPLGRSAARLRSEVEAAWGLGVDDALARPIAGSAPGG